MIAFVPVRANSKAAEDADKVIPFVIVGRLVNLALPPEIVIAVALIEELNIFVPAEILIEAIPQLNPIEFENVFVPSPVIDTVP